MPFRPPRSTSRRLARLAAPLFVLQLAAVPAAYAARYRGDEASLSKLAGHLVAARRLARRGAPVAQMSHALPDLTVTPNGAIEVEVRFRALDAALAARVAALGIDVRRIYPGHARLIAAVAPERLDALAALPEVTSVHPLYGAQVHTGVASDAGDASIRADQARAAFGVDGAGVRLGVLSDSFRDSLGGTVTGSGCDRSLSGTRPQLSADLPAAVAVLDDGPGGGSDEGAAVAEVVHDLAPGAELLFHSAFPDEAAFALGIDALRACGADVLVDDVIFFAEPMFQDGIIAQAAQAAVESGATFFSSAGNNATFGVQQAYADSDPAAEEDEPSTGADLHDFGGGARFAAVTVPHNCGVRLVLQWNEPFSGTLGPGASSDLDLYLYAADSPSASILATSAGPQGCSTEEGTAGGDPLEVVTYFNRNPQSRTVYAAVDHFCGTRDLLLRIAAFGVTCVLPERYEFDPVFAGPQIYGHAAAPGVAAVAAVLYRELDTGGTATPPAGAINVEPFSAMGGALPFFFDGHGMPLAGAPALRFRPDFAAPDGANTSFFGADSPVDPDSLPNFFGTSAAAPHAAAVAALMLEANPDLSPAAVLDALRATAADIESPGRDARSGDGVIDALDAVARAVAPPPTPTATEPAATPTPTSTPRPGDCDGDGRVAIADLIRGVAIALGSAPLSTCPAFDLDANGRVTVDEIIRGVSAALAEPAASPPPVISSGPSPEREEGGGGGLPRTGQQEGRRHE